MTPTPPGSDSTLPSPAEPIAQAGEPLPSATADVAPESDPAPAAAPMQRESPAPAAPSDDHALPPPQDGWQRLPARAIPLCTIDISLSLAVVFAIAALIVGVLNFGRHGALPSGLAGALFGAGIGMWIGFRRYRNTLWKLDAHGFAVRRGVAWQRETIVPLTRVQHLDLKHGPLQRMRRLATLVVHTAGTRHSSVAIDHLDADDAQRLRERLGRQLDLEDDEAR
ncbi:membrane protein YdbS with pleckstrin-like domain [Lysobacter enzymogenes]|uniref:PH domain-containing protein n=1 Tax=Lysobacter enzymogenes TaxID=69 RepID=UPI0033924E38